MPEMRKHRLLSIAQKVLGPAGRAPKNAFVETFGTLIPNDDVRRHALAFLAFAIQNADEERTSAWYLRETEQKLRLMTGDCSHVRFPPIYYAGRCHWACK